MPRGGPKGGPQPPQFATPEAKKKRYEKQLDSFRDPVKREQRERRQAFREQLKDLLDMPIANKAAVKMLEKMGFQKDQMCNQALLAVALYKQGVSGDVGAIRLIDEMVNPENGQQNQQNNIVINLQPVQGQQIAAIQPVQMQKEEEAFNDTTDS